MDHRLVLVIAVVAACGKGSEHGDRGSSGSATPTVTAPPLDTLTMPDAERAQLKALDPAQFLVVDKPTTSTDELAKFPGKVIVALVITHLDANSARTLASWPGDTLFLGITDLDPEVAAALATWKGTSLHLDNLKRVTTAAGTALAAWHGKTLGFGHAEVEPGAAEKLAAFHGAVAISLGGPKLDAKGVPPTASGADLAKLGEISKAIDHGDVDAVKAFLAGGGAVDMNEHGTTLLMEATNMKQVAVAKLLVDAHANVNAANRDGLTPLYYALDDFQKVPGDTPANVSALVHLLVDAGADLATKGTGMMWKSPIAQASARGDKDLVAFLMSKAPKTASVDPRTLIDAIDNADAATTKSLLAAGAEINPPSPAMGMSPIHQAIGQGASAIEMARYNKKDPAPLITKWLAVLDVVIGAGADLSVPDALGDTPLEDAINGGSLEILGRVLDAKPKLDEVDGKGRTPLQYLAGNMRMEEPKLVELAKLLRKRGVPGDAKAAAIATDHKRAKLAAVLR